MTQPLWPNNKQIKFLGVTGPHSSGKSLFLLTIADPSRTKIWDMEESLCDYESLGFDRVNLVQEMMSKNKNYKEAELYETWKKQILSTPPGQYDVLGVDPAESLENGLTEYVKSNHKEYGFKSAESFYSTGGIFWNFVRVEWKNTLLQIGNLCQTFAFSTHLKKIWKSGVPTNQVAPKGKSTFFELASLYLQLSREKEQKAPSAVVLKSRLVNHTSGPDGLIFSPVLPPRLDTATPNKIREYILAPPDYSNLKPEEIVQEKHLSEDERLELQREIAADARIAIEIERDKELIRAETERIKEAALARVKAASEQMEKLTQLSEELQGEKKKSRPIEAEEVMTEIELAKKKGYYNALKTAFEKEFNGEQLTVGKICTIPRSRYETVLSSVIS